MQPILPKMAKLTPLQKYDHGPETPKLHCNPLLKWAKLKGQKEFRSQLPEA